MGIPFVDLRQRARRPADFSAELCEGLTEFGFVGLTGHGMADETVEEARRVLAAFFALPDPVKRRYHVEGGAGQRGYTPFGIEKAKDQTRPDLKEFFHVGREVAADHPYAEVYQRNVWPREVERFEESLLALYAELESLGILVLRGIALYLGLEEDWFTERVSSGNSILRGIHYPPLSGAPGGVRAARHEDINFITLLVGSEEPGLQILTRQGRWIPVTSIPGAVVLNVGDMLQRLTNHRFPSTTHRVVNPPDRAESARSRYSMPFFLHPNADLTLRTLAQCVDAEHPDRYPEPITAHDYLLERLREIGLLGAERPRGAARR